MPTSIATSTRRMLEKPYCVPTLRDEGPMGQTDTEDSTMLTRYEPWGAIRQLQDEMNRAFGQALNNNDDGSNVVTSAWMPAVDITEEDDRFVISADVPGVDPEQIEVTMENGMLTIKGERKLEAQQEGEQGYRRVERLHGTFYRRFSLPDSADPENISAKGKHGVLEVVIPKKAAVQPRPIKVTT